MKKFATEKGCIVDFGRTVSGFVTVALREKREEIRVRYGPFQDFIIFSAPAHRQKNDYLFQCEGLLTFHFLEIEGVSPHDFEVRFANCMRPVKKAGYLKTDDAIINQIVDVCGNTVRACMLPHWCGNSTIHLQAEKSKRFAALWQGRTTDYVLMDGARRDREVWTGDLLPEIRTAWFLFRDKEVIRNSLDVILCQMDDDGYIPASSISMQCFYEYNCWFVIVLHEYLMLSGDKEYWEQNKEKVRRAVDYILRRIENGEGMRLRRMQTWAWTMSRSGFVTSSQCVLKGALDAAAHLFAEEDETYAEELSRVSNSVRRAILAKAYDRTAHCFTDTYDMDEKRYSLDANALAINFGVAEKADIPAILASVAAFFHTPYGSKTMYPPEAADGQNWVHNDHIWPFVVSMEAEARLRGGDAAGALALIRKTWGNMLRGGDTFWEAVDGADGRFVTRRFVEAADDRDTWNSACHGWSAGVAIFLQELYTGIIADDFGYRAALFRPLLAETGGVKASIPTAYGLIKIVRSGKRFDVSCPSGILLKNGIEGTCNSKGNRIGLGERMVTGTYYIP